MKNEYLKTVSSLSAIIVPVAILVVLLMHFGYTPLFTNSISFDAKIKFVNNKKPKQIDLAAIGSSITLNNLSSKVIKDSLNTSFFNFSSWGLQMNDIKEVIAKDIVNYKPKYILISSSIPDFILPGNLPALENYYNTNKFFKETFTPYFYIKNFNSIADIYTRKKATDKLERVNDQYDSLNFDDYGGALLYIPEKNISASRWNAKDPFPTNYTNSQYKNLTALCVFLKEHNIKLIFVQSPIKKSYVYSAEAQQIIDDHFNTCKNIVEKYNNIYLNFYNPQLFSDDHLFVDQFHLSAAGAEIFTKQITHNLKINHIIQ
ncbi:hypothetical protein JN11_01148 [Mucilaginibacter frigoritolerans]|uniref:GDSL-like lipase/acylhydrolase family protein n=1 Tax=Mucilaginibacter frigoritolerans TaxID=652788 RepID=A0A562UE66_9SPHI|nr:hypothetical protein [Mucilaginibacter frigoritolerans]TWJ03601.1 hypothetical protein JN11_01148 [Mucilaginibacter frigoritolerans]